MGRPKQPETKQVRARPETLALVEQWASHWGCQGPEALDRLGKLGALEAQWEHARDRALRAADYAKRLSERLETGESSG